MIRRSARIVLTDKRNAAIEAFVESNIQADHSFEHPVKRGAEPAIAAVHRSLPALSTPVAVSAAVIEAVNRRVTMAQQWQDSVDQSRRARLAVSLPPDFTSARRCIVHSHCCCHRGVRRQSGCRIVRLTSSHCVAVQICLNYASSALATSSISAHNAIQMA